MSPQKIICGECGIALYEGLELETPIETIQRHNGVCPKCGKKLDYNCDNVRIRGK